MTEKPLAQRIIDNIAADLDQRLPAHVTVRYRRPVVILPTDCPLLCVWLDNKVVAPQTTENFDSVFVIGVSWHREAVEKVETLVRDPELQVRLLNELQLIEDRIKVWARDGIGVHEAWQVLPDGVQYAGGIPQSAMVEAYALGVSVRVTEA